MKYLLIRGYSKYLIFKIKYGMDGEVYYKKIGEGNLLITQLCNEESWKRSFINKDCLIGKDRIYKENISLEDYLKLK